MKRCSTYVALAGLVAFGSGIASGADDNIRRPGGERTDLQQFFFPLTDINRGTPDLWVDPLDLQILNAYGGGIAPRVPDFIFVPVAGGGGGGGGGEIRISSSASGSTLKVPAAAVILPPDARKFVARSISLPQTQAQRSEALKALANLADVPVAQARRMFTAPAFVKDGQQIAFFRNQVQKLASRPPASPVRYAVVVAPAGAESEQMQAFRDQAKGHRTFEGVDADTLLAGTLRGSVSDSTAEELTNVITESMKGSGGQIWFANGVETVLPQTAATVLATDQVGGIVTATSRGAQAIRAIDTNGVSDAISVFGNSAQHHQGADTATSAETVKTIVEAVGPAALVTYASDADGAASAAQAIRSNKRFGDAGHVAVLLQSSAGTEMLLF